MAIFSVFCFYVEDCENNTKNISDKYEKKYKEQIEEPRKNKKTIDYALTLHFQRRLLAQFYSDLAALRYERGFPRLRRKEVQQWFTPRDVKLLAILLHMVEPAKIGFKEASNIPPELSPQDDVPMNKLLYKLYKEAEGLVPRNKQTERAKIGKNGSGN
ncbi:MAG: hypothetical protein LBF75_00150, partial [Treponema sp.]|nr:hypothetical protein [Treponema sp.]